MVEYYHNNRDIDEALVGLTGMDTAVQKRLPKAE
jgi:hypothetical protein